MNKLGLLPEDPIKQCFMFLTFVFVVGSTFYFLKERDRHFECIEALKDPNVADIVRMQMCVWMR